MVSTPVISGLFSKTLPKTLLGATALSLALLPTGMQAQTTAASTAASAPSSGLQTVAYSSSSSSSSAGNTFDGQDIDGRSLASAPDGTAPAGALTIAPPQYGGGGGGGRYHRYDSNGKLSHLAFEAGGGFTAPIGNDVNGGFTTLIGDGNNYGTDSWGGNFLVGAGWNFSKKFGVLGEYGWNTNKIPGRTLSAEYNITDAATSGEFSSSGIAAIGGNVKTQSVTGEAVYNYYNSDRHAYTGYVIGGGGFYHKSINFTAPVEEEGYFGEVFVVNQTFDSYSDNAGGVNIGTGVSFKPFGPDSRAKLFAEARYTFVATPRESAADASNTNSTAFHTGTEEIIPVTVGIRF